MKNLLNEKTLFKIIEKKELKLLENAIRLGASINAIDCDTGDTPIQFALKIADKDNYSENSTKIIHKLLDLNANVNIINEKTGETPLHLAVKRCQPATVAIIERFIELGAYVDAKDNIGQTPLFVLTASNESLNDKNFAILDCARLLVKANADIYSKVKSNKINISVKDNKSEICPMDLVNSPWKESLRKVLVEESPLFIPDAKQSDDYSMYSLATEHNLVPLQALKNDPSIVNNLDKYGCSLLHYAALARRKDIIETLIKDYGAYVDIQDNNGNTPLHLAAMNCDWASKAGNMMDDVIIPLKSFGANLNIRNNSFLIPSELGIPKDKNTMFSSFGSSNLHAMINQTLGNKVFYEISISQLQHISDLCKQAIDEKILFFNSSTKYSKERVKSNLNSLTTHKDKFDEIVNDIIKTIISIDDYEVLRHVVRHVNYVRYCYNLNITDGSDCTAIWNCNSLPSNIHDKLKNLTCIVKNIRSMSKIPQKIDRSLEVAYLKERLCSNHHKTLKLDI